MATHPAHAAPKRRQAVTPTGWVGWIWFAAVMIFIAGMFNLVNGLVAWFDGDFFVATGAGLLVFDLNTWGWIHVCVGVLQVVAGMFLFGGALWARVVAVVMALVNAIAQLTFLSAYPAWAMIVIALDVIVIWAVVVHGREADSRDWA